MILISIHPEYNFRFNQLLHPSITILLEILIPPNFTKILKMGILSGNRKIELLVYFVNLKSFRAYCKSLECRFRCFRSLKLYRFLKLRTLTAPQTSTPTKTTYNYRNVSHIRMCKYIIILHKNNIIMNNLDIDQEFEGRWILVDVRSIQKWLSVHIQISVW